MHLTEEQQAALPDLVILAMAGFALLKTDKSASEWTHPAIAAFRPDVEETLLRRELARLEGVIDRAEMWSDPTPLYPRRDDLERRIAAMEAMRQAQRGKEE